MQGVNMGEDLVPVEVVEKGKSNDLASRVKKADEDYNNFFAALRGVRDKKGNVLVEGGSTLTVSNYELNKKYPEFNGMEEPSARDYELSRLITAEMQGHGMTMSDVEVGETLMSKAKRGEKLNTDEEDLLTKLLDVIDEMFVEITTKEFEGVPFTAKEIRK